MSEKAQQAKAKIVLLNNITVYVHVEREDRIYRMWYEMAYDREEYAFFGMGGDWDEIMELCKSTQKAPQLYRSLERVNQKIESINKYQDGTCFRVQYGELVSTSAQVGA
ncbi:MAG: hypothetical protein IJF98_07485 [Firmicutes bacterium]|nr:hypothetical protein [Bacillota bacterium]